MTIGRVMAAVLPLFALGAGATGEVAGNSDELTRALRGAARPVTLTALKAVHGCGPAGCIAELGGVVIDTEAGVLRRAGGRRLALVVAGPVAAADLPEVNWTPLSGARVHRAGREWGLCFEFAHSGLGNSGRAQRWRTLVLIPARSRRAHRFIGYRASCDALVEGGRAGEVRLPIVEPIQAGADTMHIVWNRCDAQRCVREPDPRSVEGSPVSEDGSLVIH